MSALSRTRCVIARVPTAVISGASLVAGFALADATRVRALGGIVLVAGAAWCVARSVRSAGTWRLVAVVALGGVLLVSSHLAAGTLGAWGSVLLAAVLLAGATWWLVDAPRARGEDGGVSAGLEASAAVAPDRAPLPTRGMRLTEQLVRFVGPAQVGDQRGPRRAVSADEQAREDRLHTELTRVVGLDGTAYLVERAPTPPTDV